MSKSSSKGDLASRSNRDLEKAAKNGHVDSMLLLAVRKLDQGLDDSDYGASSFLAGLTWYQRAADKNSRDAVEALAEIYERGWQGCFPRFDGRLPDFESEYERLGAAVCYFEQAHELGCGYAVARIERIQLRLKELEGEDDDDSESERPR